MTIFTAISNSTIYDVCLNTYGSLNYLAKLMDDNNHLGVDTYPTQGQVFLFDETLVNVQDGTVIGSASQTKYATA